MDYKNELDKIIEQLDDFAATSVGRYILNFILGLAGILVVAIILYLLFSFATWSFPSLSWIVSGTGTFYRVLILGYAFVVFMITIDSDNDDYGPM